MRGRQWRQDGGGRWALTLRPKRSALSLIGTLSTSVPSFVTQMWPGRRGSAAKPGRRKLLAADDMASQGANNSGHARAVYSKLHAVFAK